MPPHPVTASDQAVEQHVLLNNNLRLARVAMHTAKQSNLFPLILFSNRACARGLS